MPASTAGLGLRIMSYRANMVGGSLDVRAASHGGTLICCRFPLETLRGGHHATSDGSQGRSERSTGCFVVDDHPIVRQGLALLIDQEPDLEVCGEAEEAADGAGRDLGRAAGRRRCSTSRCPGPTASIC